MSDFGDRLSRLVICGGNWNNTGNAGVFNVNLNNLRSNANGNIGFRSALPSYAGGGRIRVLSTVRGDKGVCFHSGPQGTSRSLPALIAPHGPGGFPAGRRKMVLCVRMQHRSGGDKQNRSSYGGRK